jgi:hypothetical protein
MMNMTRTKVAPASSIWALSLFTCIIICVSAVVCIWAWAGSTTSVPLAPTVVLKVETGRPSNTFRPGAVGLSLEALELDTNHFDSNHSHLVRLMRLLGPSVLRLGGNSVDLSWWTSSDESPPNWATNTITPADLHALYGLLSATGWRVLLGVDLGHFEPARAANEAYYAQKVFGARLLGIEIGNEPSSYAAKTHELRPPNYGLGAYLNEAKAYRHAISMTAPGVAIYGPALGVRTSWLAQMGTAASMFSEITQHYYPTSTCSVTSFSTLQTTNAVLLSLSVRQQEDEILGRLTHASAITGRPTRIGETNGFSCGGSTSPNAQIASALWALDWALRAGRSGVRGLNFHGRFGACNTDDDSPICATNEGAASAGDVMARPEYYGLLAARQLEGGQFVPLRETTRHPVPDLTTWATIAPNHTLTIAIDDLAIRGPSQPVSLSIPGYTAGTTETLIGPLEGARGDITFGGVPVTSSGTWRPRLVNLVRTRQSFRVVVHPASAIIVTLHRKSSHG